jgi:hypothetical protein
MTFSEATDYKISYIDGVEQVKTSLGDYSLAYNFANRRLWQYGTSNYYLLGDFAVYMVYNRVLSKEEIEINNKAFQRYGM